MIPGEIMSEKDLHQTELENIEKQDLTQARERKRAYKKYALAAGLFVIAFIAVLWVIQFVDNNSFGISDAQIYAQKFSFSTPYHSKDNTYDSSYDQFYATITVRNAPENTFLTFAWEIDDEIIFEDKIDISSADKKEFSSFLPKDIFLSPGRYNVNIYLNDHSLPTFNLTFTVEAN
jgi:hypothetical protein